MIYFNDPIVNNFSDKITLQSAQFKNSILIFSLLKKVLPLSFLLLSIKLVGKKKVAGVLSFRSISGHIFKYVLKPSSNDKQKYISLFCIPSLIIYPIIIGSNLIIL